jgi:hypothetical protein
LTFISIKFANGLAILKNSAVAWKQIVGEFDAAPRSYHEGQVDNLDEFQKECNEVPWYIPKLVPYNKREANLIPNWESPPSMDSTMFPWRERQVAISAGPLLTRCECSSLIAAAESESTSLWKKEFLHASEDRERSMPDRVPLDSLPVDWLWPTVARRLLPAIERAFPDWQGARAHHLRLYQATLLRYDAHTTPVSTPVHQDFSALTLTITLNDPDEFSGGGTWVESLGESVCPPAGWGLAHSGRTWHAGAAVRSGRRYALALFFHSKECVEHGRRFEQRSTGLIAAGRRLEAIHELQFSLQAYAHENREVGQNGDEADGATPTPLPEGQQLWGILSVLQLKEGLVLESIESARRFEEYLSPMRYFSSQGRRHPALAGAMANSELIKKIHAL